MTNDNETRKENDIALSVLSRIEHEHVVPTPRSHFLLREGVVWSIGALGVVFGALAVAGIMFTGEFSDWEYYEATHDTFFTFLIAIMPYTWIAALIVFAVLAYESVRHTKRGYRYPLPVLILFSVGASVVLGTSAFLMGAGPTIDMQAAKFVPFHHSLIERKLALWNQPERGIISGTVTEIAPLRDSFTLLAPDNTAHTIYMDTLDEDMRNDVVVGDMMRVFAPLATREEEFALDAESESVSMSAETTADAALMASEEAEDNSMMMKSAPVPDESFESSMRMDSSPELAPPPRELLREACSVLPFDRERGKPAREDRRELRAKIAKECMKSFKEGRNERMK